VPVVPITRHPLSFISQRLAQGFIGQVTGQNSFKNVSEAVFERHYGFSYEGV
jgi:hypothetical protein